LMVFLLMGALVAGPAIGKNEGEPGSKGQGHAKGKGKNKKHFTEENRSQARDYYVQEYKQTGNCPPGLAKKNNGCMPPGQAKKWQVGRPLPREVVYYEVPTVLIHQLPPPPPQHRYVRVAADILLIAVGTSMVVDAIQDLGRM